MDILLQQVKVIHEGSALHHKKVDILIRDGNIEKIAKSINKPKDVPIWHQPNAHVSIGWLDIGTQIAEPGYEHRETIASVSRAAAAGGFTGIACFPNTNPCLDSKSPIQYVQQRALGEIIDLYPIGAISQSCAGHEMTEMIDMYTAGAVAFSDGIHSIEKNGLLLRALEYAKTLDGLIISSPQENVISKNGVMNEGKISISLGLPGIPDMLEKLMTIRDIELCKYAEGRMLIHGISTPESLKVIKAAKKDKVRVQSSISYMHLVSDETLLSTFDPNYKILPPLRTEKQRKSMVKAVDQGDIDVIHSQHIPIENEGKEKEFFYADFGIIGLETCFAATNTLCHDDLRLDRLVHCLSIGPREVLRLPVTDIAEGHMANLTLFDPQYEWSYSENKIQSKSKNSPFIGRSFVGKALAIINKNQILE
mgnify:CR=1 FL=1